MTNITAAEKLEAMMSGGVVPRLHDKQAILLHEEDLPEVSLPDGSTIQLLQVDLNQNLWILRTRLKPGYAVDTHYHTGPVFAVTLSGEWFYEEYSDKVNKSGSYLFEPAHSLHTLTVSAEAKEDAVVWFAIYGSNVNIDDDNNVTSMVDARAILTMYRALCEAEGKSCDNLIVHGEG